MRVVLVAIATVVAVSLFPISGCSGGGSGGGIASATSEISVVTPVNSILPIVPTGAKLSSPVPWMFLATFDTQDNLLEFQIENPDFVLVPSDDIYMAINDKHADLKKTPGLVIVDGIGWDEDRKAIALN